MKYETALEDLKEELKPFFEGLATEGSSIFDTSRVWDIERDLELDDNSFQQELFEYLETKYDCEILTHSVDMGSYVVLHDNFTIDDNGNTHKKEQQMNEDSFLDDRFEDNNTMLFMEDF